ncbi:MAG: TnpV protein [Clostridia bacterium]|nr:TnpV protein [Clostridia bacterium]
MRSCIVIDYQVKKQIDFITFQLARAEGVNKELKAHDQLGWIQAMNFCRARAEEKAIQEIVLA